MCETLDEIQEAQLAFVMEKLRKQKVIPQNSNTLTQ